jgi:hypothetical protein
MAFGPIGRRAALRPNALLQLAGILCGVVNQASSGFEAITPSQIPVSEYSARSYATLKSYQHGKRECQYDEGRRLGHEILVY